ncbi:MAG TPA: GDP-mannose 4,6-dehydratase [Vicinamibacterales bacterium]|jgi:GDP-4-dehydro-6-deoxy-D-mannose reductase|nr:GDP-mannose 4,6-dehydratase [Vicinamibacterales bacterium]
MTDSVLVTGAAGFAGSHLVDALVADDVDVVGWHRPGGRPGSQNSVRWVPLDILDRDAVARALAAAKPTVVFHCAGTAHVGGSWRDSLTPLETNALGTHYLLDALRRSSLSPRVVVTGSALVYRPSTAALSEEAPLGPSSPYGLSKLAQEMAALGAARDGLPVVVARPFNHVGPRQDPSYATASFARQIALAEAGRGQQTIVVGNLEARRDLTDVRDTVQAYRALAERGTPGRVYNVCRGEAYTVAELLERLMSLARVRLDVQPDPALFRPNDNPIVLGDSSRIRHETGWQPTTPIERTLADLLEYWRERIAEDRRSPEESLRRS